MGRRSGPYACRCLCVIIINEDFSRMLDKCKKIANGGRFIELRVNN